MQVNAEVPLIMEHHVMSLMLQNNTKKVITDDPKIKQKLYLHITLRNTV